MVAVQAPGKEDREYHAQRPLALQVADQSSTGLLPAHMVGAAVQHLSYIGTSESDGDGSAQEMCSISPVDPGTTLAAAMSLIQAQLAPATRGSRLAKEPLHDEGQSENAVDKASWAFGGGILRHFPWSRNLRVCSGHCALGYHARTRLNPHCI